MNAFYQALEEGYSPEQVLGYISKAIPQAASMIKKANRAGYPAQQILGFLSKSFDTENRAGMSTSERHAANRRADTERAKYGLKVAGAAVASPLAAYAARGALARALPASLVPSGDQSLPTNTQTNLGGVQSSNTPLAPTLQQPQPQSQLQSASSQPPVAGNIPQQPTAIQPEIKPINVSEILNKYPGFESKINDLMKSNNTPEAIAQYFKQFNASQTKKLEKESGVPIEEIISQYIQQGTQEKKSLSREEALGKFREKIISSHEKETQEPTSLESQSQELDETQEAPKIESGHTVVSPHGMGEIKAIRNGKAIIEVDGKKHQVNEDELIQSPIPEKDLADLYDDLISGIEKSTGKQVSRNVDWAGYDPNTNELAYKPHGSDKLYAYEDISPEDVDLLTSLLTQRKSTGENFIGAWSAGTESPIGAAMYQLIKKLQAERGGKGSEYKNKYETIYDALEPAKKAAKERHAERKKKAKKPRPH